MDMDEHRRKRLRALVDKEADGNVSAYARKYGQDATRLRQILNPNYRNGRSFGEGTARRLEGDLGLPNLYFDRGIEEVGDDSGDKHKTSAPYASIKGSKQAFTQEQETIAGSIVVREGREKFDQNVAPAKIGHRHIPIISYVQAGMMTEATDPFALGEGFELILTDLDVSDGSFGLRIKGESMFPEFKEGDVVIIDPAIQPLPGDFVVAKNTEEEATFKKYRPRGTNDRGDMVFELVPLNDDFPMLQSERDHLRVIGVMVEHRKYRRR